jgi:hypothetical protein
MNEIDHSTEEKERRIGRKSKVESHDATSRARVGLMSSYPPRLMETEGDQRGKTLYGGDLPISSSIIARCYQPDMRGAASSQ